MTFRTKLLQAILAVVVLSTAASLYVVQRESSASYRAVVDELFRNQAAAFEREHETRLEFAAEEAQRLANSVRLFAALEENDPEVYKIAGDELRLGEFSFFRLLDAHGRVIPPPADGRAGAMDVDRVHGSLAPTGPIGNSSDGSPSARTSDAATSSVSDTAPTAEVRGGGADRANAGAANTAEVQVGFIELTRDGKPSIVYRVLSTPIANFDANVGSLILGERVRRLGTGPDEAHEGLHSALWLDGRLIGGDVPEALKTPLATALHASEAPTDAQVEAAGKHYRYARFRLNERSRYPPVDLVSVFPMAEFEAQQRGLALRIAATGAVALVVAGLIGVALSRQLARPIAQLVGATRRIREGHYDLELAPTSTREIDLLALSFNEMAAGLRLRDRYHAVLQQLADPAVADELVAGRIKLGGELREMTVMFCDIRNYTPLTVGRDPEEVIGILNHHMGALTRIVQAHRGVINQFAGDSIMALFGAPRTYHDDAQRAVACACAMLEERNRMNVDAEHALYVGIGISSGSMVAGCIGEESRSDYTAVGERVNLGARIAASAVAGQILIDDETRRRIDGAFVTRPLPPLQLKGFAEPVVAYEVLVGAA
jgi:class 3 adenylate cyclase